MFLRGFKKSGLTIVEYALLIAALVLALLSMQVVLRRALSSKWRETADSFGFGRQYAPDGAHKTVIVNT